MKTIWKFPLMLRDIQLVPMPIGANILTAQIQNGTLCLWAEIDTEQVKDQRVIEIAGTGNSMRKSSTPRRYINSVQDGTYVWHVFDATE